MGSEGAGDRSRSNLAHYVAEAPDERYLVSSPGPGHVGSALSEGRLDVSDFAATSTLDRTADSHRGPGSRLSGFFKDIFGGGSLDRRAQRTASPHKTLPLAHHDSGLLDVSASSLAHHQRPQHSPGLPYLSFFISLPRFSHKGMPVFPSLHVVYKSHLVPVWQTLVTPPPHTNYGITIIPLPGALFQLFANVIP